MTGLLDRWIPHVFLAALCCGLALANGARVSVVPGLAAAAVAAAVAFATDGTARHVAVCGVLLLTAWCWASARLDALDRSALAPEIGRAGRLTLAITGPARRSEFSVRVPAEVHRFGRREVREPVLLRLPPARSPPQGALVEVIGELRAPRGPEDGFDERAWLRRRGVHVVVHAGRWRLVGRRAGLPGFADRLRERLSRSMAPGLRGERRAVLAGIVLGEDEGLSRELRDSFRASGLYHLLAVSGQNVALVAGGALLLAWFVGLSRWLGELGALAAIGGYVLAVGWQPSVVRAGVAGALASLAWLAARPRDRWYFLLVGASVLLAWNPYTLFEPGFQLSFGAVAAIFVGVPPLERRLEGYPMPRWLRVVLAVSVACGLATAPIVLLHFGTVPIYSVPANALAAPAVAPLLGLAFAAAAVEPVFPSVAVALGWVNGWLAAYLAACARAIGGLPHAQVSTTTATVAALLVTAFMLAVRHMRPPRAPRVAVLLVTAALLGAGWKLTQPTGGLPPPRGLRMTFLDVGQGDSTLIQVPEGAVLVDEGPPEARVARQLRQLGVRRLAALVLTHPSRDNIGGAVDVVRSLDVGLVLEPQLPFPNPFGTPALREARQRGIRIVVTRAGRTVTLGKLRLRVLWPHGSASAADDPNDHATVLVASYGQVDALLPADAESNVLTRLPLTEVEVLKVAHHGSADDGLSDLLESLRPKVAVVSVGEDNDYGHPAPSTIAALSSAPSLAVYRTDEDGRIVLESDGTRISIRAQR
jgi:competence protein ComEC